MTILISHIWGVGALFMVANIAFARARMRALIDKGTMTSADADRFCLKAALIAILLGALFELMAWLSGVPAPCEFSLPLTDPRLLPSHLVTVLFGGASLYWVWRRGGDQTLALVGPAFSRGNVNDTTYTPNQVRLWMTVTMIVAWGGYAILRLSMPLPPPFPGCPS